MATKTITIHVQVMDRVLSHESVEQRCIQSIFEILKIYVG